MAEEISLTAKQVRLRQWAEQIRDCQNHPEGMDVSTWCAQYNITKANYYYHLKCVRKACLDQILEVTILLLRNCLNQKVKQQYLH